MEKGCQEHSTVLSTCTLSRSSAKGHEILRYNKWIKLLNCIKCHNYMISFHKFCDLINPSKDWKELFWVKRWNSTFQRQGLNSRGFWNMLGLNCWVELTSIMVHPAGIVNPAKHFYPKFHSKNIMKPIRYTW